MENPPSNPLALSQAQAAPHGVPSMPAAVAMAAAAAPPAARPTREEPIPALARTTAAASTMEERVPVFAAKAAAPVSHESVITEISAAIGEELQAIEKFACANDRDARADKISFWILKIPVILGGLGVFIAQKLNYPWMVSLIGLSGSLCVIIDGLNPRGRLYNVHRKAFHELRELEDRLASSWNILLVRHGGELDERTLRAHAANLLEDIKKEERRINQYIKLAETSLDEKGKPTKRASYK